MDDGILAMPETQIDLMKMEIIMHCVFAGHTFCRSTYLHRCFCFHIDPLAIILLYIQSRRTVHDSNIHAQF